MLFQSFIDQFSHAIIDITVPMYNLILYFFGNEFGKLDLGVV